MIISENNKVWRGQAAKRISRMKRNELRSSKNNIKDSQVQDSPKNTQIKKKPNKGSYTNNAQSLWKASTISYGKVSTGKLYK